MHMLLGIIVEADSQAEALRKAESVVENLDHFDGYNMFDGNDREYAVERWGPLPPAMKLGSPRGKKLLNRLANATKEELFENLRNLRRLLERYDDEDIWYGDNFDVLPEDRKVLRMLKHGKKDVDFNDSVTFLRHCCYYVGQYAGSAVYLYAQTGDGLRTLTELDSFIRQCNPSKTWIVPVDAHY
jgi:hypothetical protein